MKSPQQESPVNPYFHSLSKIIITSETHSTGKVVTIHSTSQTLSMFVFEYSLCREKIDLFISGTTLNMYGHSLEKRKHKVMAMFNPQKDIPPKGEK